MFTFNIKESDLEFIISSRNLSTLLHKIHINTNVIVNESISRFFIKKLKENLTPEFERFYTTIDQSVYSTGLRIMGCKKNIKDIKKEIFHLIFSFFCQEIK